MGYKANSVDGKMGDVILTHEVRDRFPTPAVGNHVTWIAPAACHITKVRAAVTGGTSCAVNAATPAGNVLAADLVVNAGATGSANAAQNTAIAAGAALTFKITAATGAPTELMMQVEYTVDSSITY